MTTNKLNCCAVHEICRLSEHKTPKAAMMAFCGRHKMYGDRLGDIGAFYIFSGIVKIKAGSTDYLGRQRRSNKVTYGPEFAAYITANKLGVVVMSPARVNRANHPDHTLRLWTWCPSIKGLEKWWDANKPKTASMW